MRIERSCSVSGSLPIRAMATADHVENWRGSWLSPTKRSTKALDRRYPLFRMPRISSLLVRKVSASSISSVG